MILNPKGFYIKGLGGYIPLSPFFLPVGEVHAIPDSPLSPAGPLLARGRG